MDDSVPARVEWVEGQGEGWSVWVFESDADIQHEDILFVDDLGLSLLVTRVMEFNDLKGRFHHFEIVAREHEETIGQIEAQLP